MTEPLQPGDLVQSVSMPEVIGIVVECWAMRPPFGNAAHSGFWCIVFVRDKLAHFDAKDVTLLSVT